MERKILLISYKFYLIINLIKTKNFRYLFFRIKESLLTRTKGFVSLGRSILKPKVAKEIDYFCKIHNYSKAVELFEQKSNTKLGLETLKKVAKSYIFLEQYNKHTSLLLLVLKQFSHLSIDELISLSRRKLENVNHIISSFETPNSLGSMVNLGIIFHRVNDEIKYLTKVIDIKFDITHIEEQFYKNLTEKYSFLKDYSPKYIDYLKVPKSNLSLLTMEFVNGEPLTINYWNKIVEFQYKLFEINYPSNTSHFLRGNFILPNKYSIKLNYLSAIKFIANFLNKRFQSGLFDDDINFLKTILLNNQHIKEILDTDNYVLQHNDFTPSNVIVNKASESVIVIDWGGLGFNIIGEDLVRIISFFEPSLNEITNKVIKRVEKFVPNSYKKVAIHLIIYSLEQRIALININPDLDFSIKDWNDAIEFIRELNDGDRFDISLSS